MRTAIKISTFAKQAGVGFQIRSYTASHFPKMDINTAYKMPSGYNIPVLGFGVYQTPAKVAEDVVLHAFKTGYRHVDSARVYRNEQPCANAMRKSGLDRGEIFFTSKVPPKSTGYEATKSSIESTLQQTGLDYIDLYLVHAPYGGKAARNGTWLALVEAQRAGKIRSLGVSNYGVHHLNELEAYIKELESQHQLGKDGQISVGQWELHPWLTRPDIVEWCKKRGIVVEAYCPIVRGQRFEDKTLQKLAKAHGRTPAQILLRWSLQKGFVPLPKSVTESRIEENSKLYDFELSKEEMNDLKTDDYSPCSWDPTVSDD